MLISITRNTYVCILYTCARVLVVLCRRRARCSRYDAAAAVAVRRRPRCRLRVRAHGVADWTIWMTWSGLNVGGDGRKRTFRTRARVR